LGNPEIQSLALRLLNVNEREVGFPAAQCFISWLKQSFGFHQKVNVTDYEVAHDSILGPVCTVLKE